MNEETRGHVLKTGTEVCYGDKRGSATRRTSNSCELTDAGTAQATRLPAFRTCLVHVARASLGQQDPSPQIIQTRAPACRAPRGPSTVLLSHEPLRSVTQGVYGGPECLHPSSLGVQAQPPHSLQRRTSASTLSRWAGLRPPGSSPWGSPTATHSWTVALSGLAQPVLTARSHNRLPQKHLHVPDGVVPMVKKNQSRKTINSASTSTLHRPTLWGRDCPERRQDSGSPPTTKPATGPGASGLSSLTSPELVLVTGDQLRGMKGLGCTVRKRESWLGTRSADLPFLTPKMKGRLANGSSLSSLQGAESDFDNDESHSHVGLFATPQTVARQAPLSTGFPKREYWSG